MLPMNRRGTTWRNVLLSAALLMGCGQGSDNAGNAENGATLDSGATSRPCGGGIACEQGTTCDWDTGGDLAVSCTCDSSNHFSCLGYSTIPEVEDPGYPSNQHVDCSANNCAGFASCQFHTAECDVVVYCMTKEENLVCKDAG